MTAYFSVISLRPLAALCMGLLFICCAPTGAVFAQDTPQPQPAATPAAGEDDPARAELNALMALPLPERVERLAAFVRERAASPASARATELLVFSRAALGEQLIAASDAPGGIEQFRRAIADAPAEMTDALFLQVVAQIPMSLFQRGQTAAALEAARLIEEKVKTDPRRLLALIAFYLNVEQPREATRIGELAVRLAPGSAATHMALGSAHRIALRLEEAAAEYARALELEPASATALIALGDLRRALGQPAEALALYRARLRAEPNDKAARAGAVLSLFDAGNRAEAEPELAGALRDDARNLALLTGAAYWYAAQGEGARALELAEQAVRVEPRYTWAQVARARALILVRRPLEAESAIRTARQYGRFPTLDYELATALAAAGLYEEAAIELARSFVVREGQVETLLAGREAARAASFIELLAPERRASIFQPVAADTEANARMLRGLLGFYLALNPAQGEAREAEAVAAAGEFVAGQDEMRLFRQLHVANRLLQRNVGMQTVMYLVDALPGGIETALNAPAAAVATMADDLRIPRERAIAAGAEPPAPLISRPELTNILRGRIEDLAGWALFNQNNPVDAIPRLRRAINILPANSLWWREALWHLGAALAANNQAGEALNTYVRSYNRNAPDPVRRTIIEGLYRRIYGSLDGLDRLIGPAPAASAGNRATNDPAQAPASAPASTSDAAPAEAAAPQPTPAATQPATEETPAITPPPAPTTQESAPPATTPAEERPAPTRRRRVTPNRR